MNFPLTTTFHHTARSARIEKEVQELAQRLGKVHPRIQQCEVVVDLPHHNHNKGNEYHIKIRLSIPGAPIVVTSTTPKHGDHTSLHNAIRDAFEAARRQLKQIRAKPRQQRVRNQKGEEAATA